MSKPQKTGLVPVLRFPEFQNAGDWDERTLGSVCDMQAGKFVRASEIKDKTADGLYPCYGGNGLRGFTETFTHNGKYSLIGRQGALCGNITLATDKFHATEHAVVVTPKEGVSTPLLYYMLIYLDLNQFATGQAQPGLSVENLEKVPLSISPEEDEQQKIADCLASIDDLITAETQKLAAIKTHKKGLMQQLFPAEGETVPRLRFPEFRDAEEWQVKPLKRVFSIFQGFAFSSNDATNQGTRWLKIADVGIQYMNVGTPSYLPANYRNEYEKFLVEAGDYVIALTRPILGKKLKMAKVDSIYDNALLNQRVGKLVTDENKDFVYCLLQTSRLISDIEKNIAGNDPPNLSSQQIGDILVRVPLGDEQQKIADCLSSVDALITAQGEKIEALKLHKKGLMQQLFPVMEEVEV